MLSKVSGLLLLACVAGLAQPTQPPSSAPGPTAKVYRLGPDDQITINALHVEEITPTPMRIGSDGMIRVPLAGLVKASGRTVGELEEEITARLRTFVLHPEVTISVMEYKSEPVSVLGSVKNPGVYQLQGNKNLAEILSMAGGVDQNAGVTVKITRAAERGPIPLSGATMDPSGKFSVGTVNLSSILKAEDPASNIVIEPRDVISVPRAELVYVVGQVQKAGGFVLNDAKTMTLLQALSMAGGFDKTASPGKAMLLRTTQGSTERAEIPVDLGKILEGKLPDKEMMPGDILFVPNSAPKRAALRALEAAIQAGTGVVIWRR